MSWGAFNIVLVDTCISFDVPVAVSVTGVSKKTYTAVSRL